VNFVMMSMSTHTRQLSVTVFRSTQYKQLDVETRLDMHASVDCESCQSVSLHSVNISVLDEAITVYLSTSKIPYDPRSRRRLSIYSRPAVMSLTRLRML
jgi:hypothetical protein